MAIHFYIFPDFPSDARLLRFSWFCFFLFVVFSAHNPSPVKCSPCKIRRTDDGRGAVKVFPDRSDKVPVSSGKYRLPRMEKLVFQSVFFPEAAVKLAIPVFRISRKHG